MTLAPVSLWLGARSGPVLGALDSSAGRAWGQNQTTWTLEAVLKQLDAGPKEFHSLTADLERTKVTVVVNDRSTETGQILVRSDNKMRIELSQPSPRTILRGAHGLYGFNPQMK